MTGDMDSRALPSISRSQKHMNIVRNITCLPFRKIVLPGPSNSRWLVDQTAVEHDLAPWKR